MPVLGVQRINKLSSLCMRSLIVVLTTSLEDLGFIWGGGGGCHSFLRICIKMEPVQAMILKKHA